jgi:hypothetical protein
MDRFENAKREILALNLDEEESAEDFIGKIFQILAENGIYKDYEWACKVGFTGG